jgi:hypothetical protein
MLALGPTIFDSYMTNPALQNVVEEISKVGGGKVDWLIK